MQRKKTNIIAMIPARMGSTRLAMKNLALLNGKPLIYYAIKAAKEAGVFDGIILNSEDDIFGRIAMRYKVGFYKRPADLASSSAKSDYVVYDFVRHNPCDIVVWVNPTSPLQTGEEVRQAVEYFVKEKLDSMITVSNAQVHCLYDEKPVNFKEDGVFAQTQDLKPVQPFVYSVMMWRAGTFKKTFAEKRHAFFCGRFGTYPVGRLSSLIIKRQEDLMLADYILRAIAKNSGYKIKYDTLVRRSRKKVGVNR